MVGKLSYNTSLMLVNVWTSYLLYGTLWSITSQHLENDYFWFKSVKL